MEPIPKIFFGTYELGHKEVYEAIKVGYRGLDTAQDYENEEAVGQAVLSYISGQDNTEKLNREDFFVVSKLASNGNSYEATYNSIAKSVRKCGLGYIDLFLMHSPWGGEEAVRTSWGAIEAAMKAKLIRYGGISNFEVEDIQNLLASGLKSRPLCNQVEVHPFNSRTELRAFCYDQGIGIQGYGPLARGLKLDNPLLLQLSGKYSCTPAQLMIRWSIQSGVTPITKSRRTARAIDSLNYDYFNIEEGDMNIMSRLDEKLIVWDLDPYRY